LGKFIVIDGLDGSGKTTQFELVKNKLSAKHKILTLSFPNYDSDSSAAVKMYLNKKIAENADDVNAFAAASFYAVDRYISFKQNWEKEFNVADIILSCRYTTSNVIHQASKLNDKKRDEFIDWLYDYEFNKLGLPKPDKVIFLNMPVSYSQKLLTNRYKDDDTKKDIHEENVEYLKRCEECALAAAKKLDWIVIDCTKTENSEVVYLTQEEINEKIMLHIEGCFTDA
jgi:dTMP kinase